MFWKRKRSTATPATPSSGRSAADSPGDTKAGNLDSLRLAGWEERKIKTHWGPFPGPRHVEEPIRLSLSRLAYSDLIAHAKGSLRTEICGVLIGTLGKDDEGLYVAVENTIRGEAARESGAHVTFTQETWNRIHQIKERDFPKQEIVGWYHSHPGFGVEFSDMDRFIHSNFFPGPEQVAMVTDPVGGEDAVIVNTSQGIRYLGRFWVEGRERRGRVPSTVSSSEAAGQDQTGSGAAPADYEALESLERRLSQLIEEIEEQQTSHSRWVLGLGMLVAFAVCLWISQMFYNQFFAPPRPPEISELAWSRLPVPLGENKLGYLGVSVAKWELSTAEMDALLRRDARILVDEMMTRKDLVEFLKQNGFVLANPSATQPAHRLDARTQTTKPASKP